MTILPAQRGTYPSFPSDSLRDQLEAPAGGLLALRLSMHKRLGQQQIVVRAMRFTF